MASYILIYSQIQWLMPLKVIGSMLKILMSEFVFGGVQQILGGSMTEDICISFSEVVHGLTGDFEISH